MEHNIILSNKILNRIFKINELINKRYKILRHFNETDFKEFKNNLSSITKNKLFLSDDKDVEYIFRKYLELPYNNNEYKNDMTIQKVAFDNIIYDVNSNLCMDKVNSHIIISYIANEDNQIYDIYYKIGIYKPEIFNCAISTFESDNLVLEKKYITTIINKLSNDDMKMCQLIDSTLECYTNGIYDMYTTIDKLYKYIKSVDIEKFRHYLKIKM